MTTKLDLKYYSPNDAKPVLYAFCFNFLCGGKSLNHYFIC